ncbi:ABC transporter substrate-binding protein [Microbacterium trichothecenolyticum]|uniref:ABC transporter substrate-binding protein n=1 Tax=Microbacterium trichothecenolyticum TaxID=69370 RepID=UPI001C6E270D|nr:ABC transporter substrate-binding protein [Microbacterium trichothecenolyticum]MBW9120486.1 ABC transporter substrate-binding protein [Microbacterium trichothecenolyticum]
MALRQSQFVPPVPLLVADAYGLLDHVSLETRRTSGSPQQLAELLAGEIDLAVTAIDNLFAWVPAGADVRVVAQVESTTPLGIFALGGPSSLAELAGRRFAVDAAGNGFALAARWLLEHAGVSGVVYREIGGVKERLDALLERRVDATLLGPPFDAIAIESGAVPLATVPDMLPGFPGQGLVARTDLSGSAELAAYLEVLEIATNISNRINDAEGIELLVGAGFGAAAASAWTTRPRTLRVPAAGLDVITRVRADLGMLPPGVVLAQLCAPGVLQA